MPPGGKRREEGGRKEERKEGGEEGKRGGRKEGRRVLLTLVLQRLSRRFNITNPESKAPSVDRAKRWIRSGDETS